MGRYDNKRADDIVLCGYDNDCDIIDPFVNMNKEFEEANHEEGMKLRIELN